MIKYLWRGKPVFGSAPDTQADLTERARAEIKRWAGRVPNGPLVATLLDSDTQLHLAPLLAAFAQSERIATERSDTLTERARVPVEKWFGRPGGYDHPMLPDVAAFGKSEREAAAAEARTECYQLLHRAFGEIEIAIFHGRALASPPAPQEDKR